MVQFPVVLCIKPPAEFRHNRCKLGTRRVLGCSGGVHSVLGVRSALARRHSEHHRTSGHLQFTRDSNSLGGASEFDRALGISLGVRCCAPQDGPRQSSRREGPADKVYGICPLPAAAAVSLQKRLWFTGVRGSNSSEASTSKLKRIPPITTSSPHNFL